MKKEMTLSTFANLVLVFALCFGVGGGGLIVAFQWASRQHDAQVEIQDNLDDVTQQKHCLVAEMFHFAREDQVTRWTELLAEERRLSGLLEEPSKLPYSATLIVVASSVLLFIGIVGLIGMSNKVKKEG